MSKLQPGDIVEIISDCEANGETATVRGYVDQDGDVEVEFHSDGEWVHLDKNDVRKVED